MPDPDYLRRKMLGANILRVRNLTPLQRAALEVLGTTPDLMGPMAQRRYEPSHTQVLAYLMSPRDGFPLATDLLRAFLELVGVGQEKIQHLQLADAEVRPEFFVSSGRVDISIKVPAAAPDEEGLLAFVEVKIDAAEGGGQLEKYQKDLSRLAGGKSSYLVFLTLHPESKRDNVVGIRFRQLLHSWLPVVACHSRDWTCTYAAAYLKTLSILTHTAADGTFNDWNFARQRAALDAVEEIREE